MKREIQNSKKRNVFFGSITIVVAILISFFFIELITRIYFFGTDSFSISKMNSVGSFMSPKWIRSSTNKNIVYELKPNLNSLLMMKKVRTNSLGFRGEDITMKKQPGAFRIVVIGDSFTMGWGVDEKETYPSLLERRLNGIDNSASVLGNTFDHYEVLNLGVPGYSLTNYNGVLSSKVASLEPDLVIIGFCGLNDFNRFSNKALGNWKLTHDRQPYFQSSFFIRALLNNYINISNTNSRVYTANSVPGASAEEIDHIAHIESEFKKFAKYSRKNDLPVVITYLSLFSDPLKEQIVEQTAKKYSLRFVDTSDGFNSDNVFEYITIPHFDFHPNKRAQQIYADKIYDYISEYPDNERKFKQY